MSFFTFLTFHAQVDKTTYKGKTYYVYPFQAAVEYNNRIFNMYADSVEEIQRDDNNQRIVGVEVVKNPNHNRYKKQLKNLTKSEIENSIVVLEHFPEEWIEVENNLLKDITPALTTLPDGDYIQYYRDLPYVKNKVLRFKNDVVAGIFSIKNNQLEGVSYWYNAKGQLIKTGNYGLGSKTGEWKQYDYSENYMAFKDKKKFDVMEYYKSVTYDTAMVIQSFKDGLRHGKYEFYDENKLMESGEYTYNEQSGTWSFYMKKAEKQISPEGYRTVLISNDVILKSRFTYAPNESRGKSVIIRDEVIPYSYRYQDYERKDQPKYYFKDTLFPYFNQDGFPSFSSFFTVDKMEEELDLPEEGFKSFETEEEYGMDDYHFPMFEEMTEDTVRFSRYDLTRFYNGKQRLLNDVIDSVGYHFTFEGKVERYHRNGQLMYEFVVENGVLKSMSPVYYENGQIANEVVYLSDSAIYIQRYFDYYGQKYLELRYDNHGKVIDNETVEENYDRVDINQKSYYVNIGNPTFAYSADKELKAGVTTKLLVEEELWKVDSTVASTSYFDPATRTLFTTQYNLAHEVYSTEETVFSEDYQSCTSTLKMKFRNLSMEQVASGTFNDYFRFFYPMQMKADTGSLQTRVINWKSKYNLDADVVLSVNDMPFNGKVTVKSDTRKFGFKASSKEIVYGIPKTKQDVKLYHKLVNAYVYKGKKGKDLDLYVPSFGGFATLTASPLNFLYWFNEVRTNYSSSFAYNYDAPFMENMTEEDLFMSGMIGNFDVEDGAQMYSMSGQFKNGKPEGFLVGLGEKGKIIQQIPYVNGDRNGTMNKYDFAYPEHKTTRKEIKRLKKNYGEDWEAVMEEMSYEYDMPQILKDSLPAKKTYYLSETMGYKNGMMHGTMASLNWLGDTLSMSNYTDGVQEGMSFERNKLFYTESTYENGAIDGITRTYLTPADRDSVLLFELNFQNGELQGQSVAYHANGKIAKKGFFLSGRPIDDYEAYDTLGFRYQYVKFQYNQPIEEKIWEENQLSVRYQFDWKDSIPFYVGDITSATSIESLIYQMGLDDGSMYAPYYGRPSLVSKGGIDYTMTKYYPNDTIAREGFISKGKKTGCWSYYNYFGTKLMEVDYFDTLLTINDTLKFNSKGVLTYVDTLGNELSKSYIIEKIEKYDCAHSDHNEERMLYGFWERDTLQHRINGYTKNYYDNGALMNEGMVKNGLPNGIWKMYDVDGHLSHVGVYVNGKRDGRWLKGDLGSVKNMSEICLNPNLENLEEILKYQEKLLDISVVYYRLGKQIRSQYYGINLNNQDAPEGYFEGEEYYGE